MTGLDYFNARYYDPVTGQFLSVDVVQGNAQGTSPYRYMAGNPETRTDPTGQMITCGSCGSSGPPNANDCAADPSLSGCSTPASQGDDWEQDPSMNPVVQPTHINPKVVKGPASKQTGCNNKTCGDRDKQLIKNYLSGRKTFWANVSTAIGDGIALLGDIVSTVLHLLAQDWAGFGIELASTLFRAAAFIGDLGKLGILSMPLWVADILSGLKWVSTVIDVLSGIFEWANPLTATVNLFGRWAVKQAELQGASRIAQFIASGLSITGTALVPNLDAAYWDKQMTEVNTYSNQQAYNVCVQDQASEPGIPC